MDTLGALVFGIVIVNAIRSRGVESPQLITRYAIIAGLIAGVGLALVYISLFRLGSGSHEVALVPPTVLRFCMPTCSTPSVPGQRLPRGADLPGLPGDCGRPDLRLRRVLQPGIAAVLQALVVILWRCSRCWSPTWA